MTDILQQLKTEHDIVRSILAQIENSTARERISLLKQLKSELIPHARAEEKTVYATLDDRNGDDDQHRIEEAYEEHRIIDKLLTEMGDLDPTEDQWLGRFSVLKENISHHADEEEKELFPVIRKNFSKSELIEMRKVFQIAKDRFEETLPTQSQIAARSMSPEANAMDTH